jgi:sodium-independent sulfate anion transporter 11
MAAQSSRISAVAAKSLGIKIEYRNEEPEALTGGNSITSLAESDLFYEREPTVGEWLREVLPGRGFLKKYFTDLFPFLAWITRYNTQWLTGDIIAGKDFNHQC